MSYDSYHSDRSDPTGYSEKPPRPIKNDGPWKCDGACGEWIYNTEVVRLPDWKVSQIIPRPGRPTPLYITGVGNVCHVCWDIYHAVNNHLSVESSHGVHWFRDLHEEWAKKKEERKRQYDKLKPGSEGGNYFI